MNVKTPIPKAKGFDNTLTLIKEGFDFLPKRRRELGSDMFETRLLGKKVVCIGGEDAAKVFYDNNLFKRKGAAPAPLKKSLLGKGGAHGMDGEPHKHRKRMFLSMMTPDRLEELKRIAIRQLDAKVTEWEKMDKVIFFNEVQEVLTRTGCEWAGVPLDEKEVKQRTRELAAMVDSFGGSITRFNAGKKARESQEKWLKGTIKAIRNGDLAPPANTAAYIIANHREMNGKPLDDHTAAVELNNVIRPLIATAYYLTFGAVALFEHPQVVQKVKEDKDNYSHMFAQEVRRYYPFAPAMAAKVKQDFTWHEYQFKKNMLVVLDIFGTNRHPLSWDNPDEFRPERFKDWKESPFSFIPQGGGDHHIGHRCAGEWMTVLIMRAFFKYVSDHVSYTVPKQDLSYSMSRMPTIPKSGFVITEVKKTKSSTKDLEKTSKTQTVMRS
ncbi:cytochrome P450 [Alteribacter keqinensis]|uniref:Cytochrome P450 n=1 Tax=Alteribacter keqinensis TaxID=2483800 RepID=A0A3M7TWD3_9BACI|nr:cytochrome P450 [Alteribacter keqinensis]RNA69927.1 cytochrome P450 [Alteribacter keqinensis]